MTETKVCSQGKSRASRCLPLLCSGSLDLLLAFFIGSECSFWVHIFLLVHHSNSWLAIWGPATQPCTNWCHSGLWIIWPNHLGGLAGSHSHSSHTWVPPLAGRWGSSAPRHCLECSYWWAIGYSPKCDTSWIRKVHYGGKLVGQERLTELWGWWSRWYLLNAP